MKPTLYKFFIILNILILISTKTYARTPKDVLLNYDIYAGGFKVLAAELDMSSSETNYKMNLNAHTQGFIGSLFPWEAEYNTAGKNENGKLIPTLSEEKSSWRGKEKTTKMNYDAKGQVTDKTVNKDGKVYTEKEVDKLLSGNAVDVLTGVLNMMQIVKNSNECNGKIPVFDGKRKFNINLKNEGKKVIEPSRYSVFSGETVKCTLTVEPVAGFKEKDKNRGWLAIQNHSEEYHQLPTIFLAKTQISQQVIPVRLEFKSSYGMVIAHLSKETAK